MNTAPIRIIRLPGSFESFGRLVDYLAGIQPFARYDLGNFSRALQYQLAEGNNLAALAGNRLAGYCGWLPTTVAAASAWTRGDGPLHPVDKATADAVVVTVLTAADRATLTLLIQHGRQLIPGMQVFFKREYADRLRTGRKAHVTNAGP